MDAEPELEMGDWEPHELDSFLPSQRPTIELLNRFGEAFYGGQIPRHCWRSTGPDYRRQQIVLTIYPDDDDFRAAVAEVMPPNSYRILVRDEQYLG